MTQSVAANPGTEFKSHSARLCLVIFEKATNTVYIPLVRRKHSNDSFKLPGGKREGENESAIETALREFREETGYILPIGGFKISQHSRKLGTIHGTNEPYAKYVYHGLIQVDRLIDLPRATVDESEKEECFDLSFQQINEFIKNGAIHTKHAGVLWSIISKNYLHL